MCEDICLYAGLCLQCPWSPEEGVRPPRTRGTAVVHCLMWALGTRLGSSGRAARFSIVSNPFFFLKKNYVFMWCVCACMCDGKHVQVRGKLCGLSVFPNLYLGS